MDLASRGVGFGSRGVELACRVVREWVWRVDEWSWQQTPILPDSPIPLPHSPTPLPNSLTCQLHSPTCHIHSPTHQLHFPTCQPRSQNSLWNVKWLSWKSSGSPLSLLNRNGWNLFFSLSFSRCLHTQNISSCTFSDNLRFSSLAQSCVTFSCDIFLFTMILFRIMGWFSYTWIPFQKSICHFYSV